MTATAEVNTWKRRFFPIHIGHKAEDCVKRFQNSETIFKKLETELDGELIMSSSSLCTLNCSPPVRRNVKEKGTQSARRRIRLLQAMASESGNLPVMKKLSSSGKAVSSCKKENSLFGQSNTIVIVGGMSDYSTLLFLEKFSRNLKDENVSIPFVICNDPGLREEHFTRSDSQNGFKNNPVLANLSRKLAFLENLGAGCIVMPCNFLHQWHSEVSERCNLPILHLGDCVAKELKEAKLKPLEPGSRVRIGVLAISPTPMHSFYQEKLQNEGFEVVLPDKATMEHMVIPAMEAWKRRDEEGARNLLRIAIHVLLVKAVNSVILASDELQGLLPLDDPLLQKCVDPVDALAKAAINWSKSAGKFT